MEGEGEKRDEDKMDGGLFVVRRGAGNTRTRETL